MAPRAQTEEAAAWFYAVFSAVQEVPHGKVDDGLEYAVETCLSNNQGDNIRTYRTAPGKA